jgi:hypothetical protein
MLFWWSRCCPAVVPLLTRCRVDPLSWNYL